jgi:hypothetical protein
MACDTKENKSTKREQKDKKESNWCSTFQLFKTGKKKKKNGRDGKALTCITHWRKRMGKQSPGSRDMSKKRGQNRERIEPKKEEEKAEMKREESNRAF